MNPLHVRIAGVARVRYGYIASWLEHLLGSKNHGIFLRHRPPLMRAAPPRNKVINNHDLFNNPSRKALFLGGEALSRAWPLRFPWTKPKDGKDSRFAMDASLWDFPYICIQLKGLVPSAPNTLWGSVLIGTQNPLQNYMQKGAVSIRVSLVGHNFWRLVLIKGQLGVPLTVYPGHLLCSPGILGDCNLINTHYTRLV